MTNSIELKDVVLLGLGLAGGYAISYYFHRKQIADSGVTHSELITALDRNYEQALRNGIKGSNVIHMVKMAEGEVENLSDLVEIRSKMDDVLSFLKARKKGQELPFEKVIKYKTLGDRWSEIASIQLDLKILDQSGTLDISRLIAVHRSIFPDNFPWAGKYRDQHVYVVDNFGTTARVVDIVQAESKIGTIAPEAIEKNLNSLLDVWNTNIGRTIQSGSEVKIEEVAHFHHEFELIHPFMDGNGRIGRMLLEEQLSFLFQTKVKFSADRDDYYASLRMMNMGSSKEFVELITAELKRFNVAL